MKTLCTIQNDEEYNYIDDHENNELRRKSRLLLVEGKQGAIDKIHIGRCVQAVASCIVFSILQEHRSR